MEASQEISLLRRATAKAWRKANLAPIEAFDNCDLFANPGWALIIELYISQAEKRPLKLDEACSCMRVPRSTALRWIGLFERAGWLNALGEAASTHPKFLRLSEEGRSRAEAALDLAVAGDRSLGLERLDFAQ